VLVVLRESIRENETASRIVPDRVRAIFDGIADGVVIADASGNLLDWNPAALRLHGYSTVDEVRRHLAHFQNTFELSSLNGTLLSMEDWPIIRALRGESVTSYELSMRRVDTGQQWIISYDAAWVRLDSTDGPSDHIVLTIRDLTAHRSAEVAHEQSQRALGALIESLPQLVWTARADRSCDYLSPQWIAYTGVPVERHLEYGWIEAIHPGDRQPTIDAWSRASTDGNILDVEFRIRRADGVYRWFKARGVPQRDGNGQISRWIGTNTDIHEQRLTSEALRESISGLRRAEDESRENQARLQGVLESAVEGIITIDERGTIETVNRAVVTTFGYSSEEMIGENVRMLMPLPYATEHDGYLANYLRTGERKVIGLGREVVGRRKDRSTFPVDLSVSEVLVGGRRLFTGIVRDITARKSAEGRARDQQNELAHMERVRTMGQMASGLAHELNQPLGAIANYAGAGQTMIGSGRATPERLAEMLGEIQAEALRAGEIIQRLRSFVKKQRPKGQSLRPKVLMDSAVRMLSYDLRQAQVEPSLVVAERLPSVIADAVQVGQVMVNLIRNALDAMQSVEAAKRSVTIACVSAGNESVQFSIADSGCGVPAEHLGHIFDAFYTTKPGGLGVGLALCRTIIEDHGGQLTAAPNPTGGMTFSFTLRRAAPTSADAGELTSTEVVR
jgi:two-component system sensor kinase FixL